MKYTKIINFSHRLFLSSCLAVIFLFGFGSCRQTLDLHSPDSYASLSPAGSINYPAVFESFWKGMNVDYLFWEIDPTNWDDIWDTYKPRFDALGTKPVDDNNSAWLAYNYFVDMTENIVDGHYGIEFAGKPRISPNRVHLKLRDGWDQRESLMNWVDWVDTAAPPKKGETSTHYNLFANVTRPKYIINDSSTYSSGSTNPLLLIIPNSSRVTAGLTIPPGFPKE